MRHRPMIEADIWNLKLIEITCFVDYRKRGRSRTYVGLLDFATQGLDWRHEAIPACLYPIESESLRRLDLGFGSELWFP